jgi:DNA-binding transcriptional LysR family regulator
LELFSFEVGQIKEALKTNTIDLAITLHFQGQESDIYRVDRIVEDSFVVVVPSSHRLAENLSISVADLENEILLGVNQQTAPELSEFLCRQLEDTGLLEHMDYRINDVNSLSILMSTNMELALSLMHLNGFYGPYFKFIPLEGVDLSCELAAIWKKSKEKEGIARFVECIHKAIDALSILEKAL